MLVALYKVGHLSYCNTNDDNDETEHDMTATMITSVTLPMSNALAQSMLADLPGAGFDVRVQGARRTAFGFTLETFSVVTVSVPEAHAAPRRALMGIALADFARANRVIA